MPQIDEKKALRISKQLNVSLLAANILCARGFEFEDAKDFLTMDAALFHDPFLLNDMQKAVMRIKDAIDMKEKIAVYGDYDVDGITATYILFDYLKSCGADVIYYIPDRIDEGYGINIQAIETLKSENVNLIITVDVGITAVEEVEHARLYGIDVIITDHHTLKDVLPAAVAVINPKISDAGYPFDALAGVGVAFKLIYALSGLNKKIFDRYCDIAAVGTIADMVPLRGENRYIASVGIEKLKNTQNKGLKAIMSVAGINCEEISSTDVSFAIAPRLNAAGRISHASQSVDLLSETDDTKALLRAQALDNCNKKRQQEEQVIFAEAMEIIEKNKLENDNFIVVAKEGWAHGIIGIVSSKITEKFYRPSAVISINSDGTGKASGRSIKGINLFNALNSCSNTLLRFGGHELAAGFTVQSGMVDVFRQNINSFVNPMLTEDIKTPSVEIDAIASLGDICLESANSIKSLEPYGIDNKMPVICIEELTVCSIRYTKNGKHAFVTVTKDGISEEFPAFSMAEKIKEFMPGDKISVAGNLGINSFRGTVRAQFVIRDIKYCDSKVTISRSELACIFTDIKHRIDSGTISFDNTACLRVSSLKKLKLRNPKILSALNIFKELGILVIDDLNHSIILTQGENFTKKTNLSDSETFVNHNREF